MEKSDKAIVQLQWGLRKEKLVHISEILEEERGLACDCKCPNCKAVLQARLGKKRQRHFSHHTETACDIEHAQQTALHMLAKEIIEQEKSIKFPELLIKFEDLELAQDGDNAYIWRSWNNRHFGHQYNDYVEKLDESVVSFDQITLEKKVSSIIPDILARKGDKNCLIEIAVTHFVDEEKQKAIESLGIATIEVDISEYVHSEITREELREVLVSKTAQKRWVFNPKRKALIAAAEEKVKPVLDEQRVWIQKNIDRIERIKLEERRKAEIKNKKRIDGIKAINEALIPENYAQIIMSLKNDTLALHLYGSRWMSRQQKDIPFYLNIPICGEMIFRCDRRIWQIDLFEKFVYNRKTTDISQTKIEAYLTNRQRSIEIDWKYSYKTYNEHNRKEHCFLKDVITRYFYYLDSLGFIRIEDGFKGFFGEVIAPHSLNPPNKDYARLLELALRQVDEFSPSVSEDIAKSIKQQMGPLGR